MAKRPIEGMRTIVTGASSGIGLELARQLARDGARLVVTARRADRLDELVAELQQLGGSAVPVAGDIVEPATREALLAAAVEHYGGLDAVINNAGVGGHGPFAEADAERLRRIMEVNLFAPVELIRSALPLLKAGNRPIIVNVGSVLGHFAIPNKSEYCASKFALHGFSDALRCELATHDMDVLLVSPSTTRSEFFARQFGDDDEAATERGGMSPAAVARKTVRAIRRGRHEIILSVGGKLIVWLDRLCPAITGRLIARFAP